MSDRHPFLLRLTVSALSSSGQKMALQPSHHVSTACFRGRHTASHDLMEEEKFSQYSAAPLCSFQLTRTISQSRLSSTRSPNVVHGPDGVSETFRLISSPDLG